jgi:Ca-activated chloride channel family protein
MERAKKALGLSKESAAPATGAKMAMDEVAPAEEAEIAGGASEDIGGMFARQLASGLWESRDTSDQGRLAETTACLSRCVRDSVDSSHSIYGAQVVKAVDALCTAAERLAQKGEADDVVIRALLVAAVVSTGKRARARLAAIAQGAKSGAVKAIAADLSSQEAARNKLG